MLPLVALLLWVALSIPATLIIGRVLAGVDKRTMMLPIPASGAASSGRHLVRR